MAHLRAHLQRSLQDPERLKALPEVPCQQLGSCCAQRLLQVAQANEVAAVFLHGHHEPLGPRLCVARIA